MIDPEAPRLWPHEFRAVPFASHAEMAAARAAVEARGVLPSRDAAFMRKYIVTPSHVLELQPDPAAAAAAPAGTFRSWATRGRPTRGS